MSELLGQEMILSLDDILHVLRTADRVGLDEDSPEGSRWIQISDTLAKRMVKVLEDAEFELCG